MPGEINNDLYNMVSVPPYTTTNLTVVANWHVPDEAEYANLDLYLWLPENVADNAERSIADIWLIMFQFILRIRISGKGNFTPCRPTDTWQACLQLHQNLKGNWHTLSTIAMAGAIHSIWAAEIASRWNRSPLPEKSLR